MKELQKVNTNTIKMIFYYGKKQKMVLLGIVLGAKVDPAGI